MSRADAADFDTDTISEGHLMVETRATADGVSLWIGHEVRHGLDQFAGTLPAELAEAIGHALVAKANVARAIAAVKDQMEMPV